MTRDFVGTTPLIYAGLDTLGITKDGKYTFGRHGSNLVMPVRGVPAKSKRLFRTDDNGNPIPMSDDEIALAQKAKDETQMQAASEAATPVVEAKPTNTPWYDFLKHPQNTPYEQEQMRNQGILRDAAIAAAMNKPVFFPEADTLSEPMAKLAGQQAGLAQSAMGQFTSRQGMAADMYKQVTNLANSYAAQSMQAQMAAQKLKANSDESANNAKVYEQQAAAIFGQMPKDMQDASKRPDFLEVVRSKYDEKALAMAQQYDALKRSQAMLENDALSKNEQANSYLAKAKAFGDGVANLDRDWNLGLNFNAGGVTPYDVKKTTQPVQFAGQGDVGRNEVPIATPSGFSAVGSTPQADNKNNGFSLGGDYEKQLANFGLKFDPNTGKIYKPKSGGTDKKVITDPIAKRIARLSTGKDVDIARFAARGSRLNLDTGFQAAKDKAAWLTELGAVANEIAKNPENVSKYKDFIYEVIKGGEGRFGNAASILKKDPSLNIPVNRGLKFYKNDIISKNAEGNIEALWNYYNRAEKGAGLTKQQLDDMQKILTKNYTHENYGGAVKPLFENNGLKLNYSPLIDPETGEQLVNKNGNKLYQLNLEDSFK